AFTRFVLPFRWRRGKKIDAGTHSKYWKDHDLVDWGLAERKKYFTQETGKVLYDRARWLELVGFSASPWSEGVNILPCKDGKAIKACMATPRMVLFEWGREKEGKFGGGMDILHSGFLLLDVFLEREERHPTLDDLLTFNEVFRYLDRPYKEHYHKHFTKVFGDTPTGFFSSDRNETDNNPQAAYFRRWQELLEIPLDDCDGCYR
ncbi:hypothetical protein QQ73_00355, partial [Candidatus Endoriftia persephone str. Guaymas]|nr:hypothetical protein [Candidatus Endoriftia persephone str. Guaymas]